MATTDELIPPERWGKDHWSTFAYIETRLVDHGPYIVGIDPRMKTNRRHLLVFADARAYAYTGARSYFNNRGQPTMRPEDATTLNDGTQVPGHDDWMCLQDMLVAGLLKVWGNEIQPGRKVRLSPLGLDVAAKLRAHKASGGNFINFTWAPGPDVTRSSGNVFADLGLPDPERLLAEADARIAAERSE